MQRPLNGKKNQRHREMLPLSIILGIVIRMDWAQRKTLQRPLNGSKNQRRRDMLPLSIILGISVKTMFADSIGPAIKRKAKQTSLKEAGR